MHAQNAFVADMEVGWVPRRARSIMLSHAGRNADSKEVARLKQVGRASALVTRTADKGRACSTKLDPSLHQVS